MWLILLLTLGSTCGLSPHSWTITNAVTKIHLAPQKVKIVSELKLSSSKPTDKLHFSISDENPVYISASSGNQPLMMKKVQDQNATWEISMPEITSAAEISVTYFYTALVRLSEATMEEDEDQTWEFRGNVNVFSPYVAQKQETIIQAGGKNLKMGPAYNVAPFTSRYETIHFRDSSPVPYVSNAIREIFISNWGKIYIRDSSMLENRAAVSGKPFSRLKLPKNAITDWTTQVPHGAEDIYYGDSLGVIYSYLQRPSMDGIAVKLKPRYPILAGWKTEYQLSYNLPAHEYLTTNGSRFCLDINYMDEVFQPFVVEDLTVKITLPEESRFSGEIPDGFTRLSNEWVHATLDTFGRLVLVFNKKNIVEGEVNNVHICYTNELGSFARVAMNGIRASLYIFTLLFAFGSLYRFNMSE